MKDTREIWRPSGKCRTIAEEPDLELRRVYGRGMAHATSFADLPARASPREFMFVPVGGLGTPSSKP